MNLSHWSRVRSRRPARLLAALVTFVVACSGASCEPANGTAPPPGQPEGGGPAVSADVHVSARFADGTSADVTLKPGERRPFSGDVAHGSAILHADGKSVCIENPYVGTTGPLTGHFTVAAGAATLFDGDLTIGAYKRTRPFWVVPPTPKSNPDWSAFPKRSGGEKAGMSAAYMQADNGPMGRGLAYPAFEATGERPDLSGPLWDVAYITNPTPDNAVVVRGMSDAASVWGVHVVDPATNEMVNMQGNPYISLLEAAFDQNNPIKKFSDDGTGLSLSQAQAHATNFSLVAAEAYGTDYDREEVGFWANYYESLWQAPGSRLAEGCVAFTGQVRGKARGLDYLLLATKYAPSKWQPLFDSWVRALAADGKSRWLSQSGIAVDQYIPVGASGSANDYAPWAQQLLISAIGHAIDYGYTDYQPILDYFAPVIFDSILGDGKTPAVQHEFASGYRSPYKYADGTRVADWRASCVERATRATESAFAAALALPESSLARIQAMYPTDNSYIAGDFCEYPMSPTGYPAMLRTAVVALARHATDQTRAQAAWTAFQAHYRADHSTDPKYDFIP